MLHTRTKKVASYGRRTQRVVAVSGDRRFSFNASPDASVEHLDDENPFRSAYEEKDADEIYVRPIKYSSKSFKVDRKKSKPPEVPLKSQKAIGRKLGARSTSTRTPLGSYPLNIPNSPVVPPKLLKARAAARKGTPSRPRKIHNISPYVDVDITVIDDSGRRLSEERRVTKMNVQVNDFDGNRAKTVRRAGRATAVQTYAIFVSEEEDDGEDDEYVPSHKNTFNKREVKERGSGLSLRNGRDSVQKARRMRTSENKPASDRPGSETPRRSKASKRTARIIVLSDSDSDVSVTGATGTKEACNAGIGGPSNVQPTNAKIDGESTDPALKDILGQVNPVHTRHDVRISHSPTCQKERKAYLGRKSYRSKSALPARTNQGASTQRRTDQNLPLQERISVEYDPSHARPRQLTPIKSSSSKAAFLQQRPVRSSPSRLTVLSDEDTSLSIDDELQLALEVADLELAKPPQPSSRPPVTDGLIASKPQRRSEIPHVPTFLRSLLSECGQVAPFHFDAFIETFPVDPIIGFSGHTATSENLSNGKSFSLFQKVGEASYSEVFGIGNVVLKIVPLLDEEHDISATWTADWDSPPVSDARDVLKEIVVTRAMGDICKGFIKLLKAHVVQGSYPKSLLALWDHFDKLKGSESVRPAHFSPLQTYAIIVLPNGGPDLENFSFGHANPTGASRWRQACSIFWQVTQSLGKAEELVRFEHRDLHWGQILVRNTMKAPRFLAYDAHGTIPFDDPSHGIQATIIDLGLSRIDQGHDASYWTPFTDEIFEGEGDYQYDVYRMMRKHNKDEWRTFKPLTNVMWLHYLTSKLINHKHIPLPVCASGRRSRKSIRVEASPAITDPDKRAYECLVEVEHILRSSITSVARSAGVKLPKLTKGSSVLDSVHKPVVRVTSAADMLRLGKERKWVL